MNRSFLFIFLSIAVGLIVFCNILIIQKNGDYKKELEDQSNKNKELINCYLKSVIANNYKLNRDLTFSTIDRQQLNINYFLAESPKLVFVHKSTDCEYCVEKEMLLLNEFSKAIGIKNIIILADVKEFKAAAIFKATYEIKCKVLLISNNSGNTFPETGNLPYYFIIDKDLVIKHMFIPDSNMPELTKAFFKYVNSLLNN